MHAVPCYVAPWQVNQRCRSACCRSLPRKPSGQETLHPLLSLGPVKRSVRSPCSSARLERHFPIIIAHGGGLLSACLHTLQGGRYTLTLTYVNTLQRHTLQNHGGPRLRSGGLAVCARRADGRVHVGRRAHAQAASRSATLGQQRPERLRRSGLRPRAVARRGVQGARSTLVCRPRRRLALACTTFSMRLPTQAGRRRAALCQRRRGCPRRVCQPSANSTQIGWRCSTRRPAAADRPRVPPRSAKAAWPELQARQAWHCISNEQSMLFILSGSAPTHWAHPARVPPPPAMPAAPRSTQVPQAARTARSLATAAASGPATLAINARPASVSASAAAPAASAASAASAAAVRAPATAAARRDSTANSDAAAASAAAAAAAAPGFAPGRSAAAWRRRSSCMPFTHVHRRPPRWALCHKHSAAAREATEGAAKQKSPRLDWPEQSPARLEEAGERAARGRRRQQPQRGRAVVGRQVRQHARAAA